MPRGMKRFSHRRMGTAALLALTVTATCGAGRVVIPFSIDPATIPVPRDARTLNNHEAAVRGLTAILVRDLGLPMPTTFTLYVYGGRQPFEHGLVQDAQVAPTRAAELSEFAVGIGERGERLRNGDGGQRRGREWLRLIAHELAHVSQIEMAGGEGRAEQWLAEGMAEWVAFTSLEHLGLDTLANRRALATAGIRNHAALVAARLDLETLGNPRGFTVRHLKEGSLPTYQLAFLMADYLIERDGFERVVAYFKSFERRQDPPLKTEDRQPERRAAVRKIATEVFDVQETARRALGPHWQQRTPQQREEFVQLFAELVEQTYISKIDLFGGERLRFTEEKVDGDNAIVRAKVMTSQQTEVPVEARLLRKTDRWLIYDILIENISLIGNYRAQFDRIIRTSSYEDLVKRLRSRGEFLKESERPRRTER